MRVAAAAIATVSALLLGFTLPLAAQTPGGGPPPGDTRPSPMLKEGAEQLSPHVWLMRGNPNIAIVIGSKATLVVDTGLGTRNGEIVARTVAKLAKGPTLYLTTTHFHPEHAAGEAGFPKGTILIRPRVQQEELEADKGAMLDAFRRFAGELLEGFSYRKPDRLFDKEERLDLGGVHVRLIWAGPAHTRGDELVLVEEDSVLVSGDVVQNRTAPNIAVAGITPRDWLKTVEALVPLQPKLVVPDHSDPGPGVAMIRAQRDFLRDLDDRARALKAKGVPAAEAGRNVTAELKAKYPDWTIRDLSGLVARAYSE